ncbi:Ribosomal protein S18 acetylase RimI [Andreprevotia lacus DSM 23236]|jgi:ribosomal protein S18 acetylase RimI-like enzyme|uniref:Ribosomal protein S18 acetylase RimI n=1 Tax=Andreprevotia lacus DSM 23236 TaxID=1121001 RepID=A0A1W1XLD6_9NEIS|nr:GNAT family N-acetyltransferase [Andreprevotia lacus]SMC24338.1 Ribosomal protein S18 acetylase RimI [Andreprevotia lacus DSM 23236]
MNIRPLGNPDAGAYQALRLLALAEQPAAFASSHAEEAGRSVEQIRGFLCGSADRVVLGAFDGETLIGVVGIGREGSLKLRHKAFIRSMYVASSYRRQGIGQRLIAEALAIARAWVDVAQITLVVTDGNSEALQLYQQAGFKEYGREPRALLVDGRHYDDILMWRGTDAH